MVRLKELIKKHGHWGHKRGCKCLRTKGQSSYPGLAKAPQYKDISQVTSNRVDVAYWLEHAVVIIQYVKRKKVYGNLFECFTMCCILYYKKCAYTVITRCPCSVQLVAIL